MLASKKKEPVPGPSIKYFMATCGKQNCDKVCSSFGLQCASSGQSFPNTSALPIFESLGITCETNYSTDVYEYKDQPNYITDSADGNKEWVGRCTGFKAIPSTIDCQTANNMNVRRLCPCYDPAATQPPAKSTATLTAAVSTQKITTTATEDVVTSAEPRATHVTHEQPTENDLAQPQKQTEGTNDDERTALIVVAILAAGLVVCLVGLVFLFLWNRRQLRSKQEDEEPDSEKLHLEYRKSNNAVPDMMDGLTVEINTEEGNRYCDMRPADLSLHNVNEIDVKNSAKEGSSYEDMAGRSSDNVLYASSPVETRGETNTAFFAEQTAPVYDRLV